MFIVHNFSIGKISVCVYKKDDCVHSKHIKLKLASRVYWLDRIAIYIH